VVGNPGRLDAALQALELRQVLDSDTPCIAIG
jgi:hypothetical protein